MKKELLVVTAAIIKKNGKYLITQRPKRKHLAGLWEFPGGIVEFGENPINCLKREVKEELGINIRVKNFFDYSSYIYYGRKQVILLAFFSNFNSGKIKKLGIQDYKWVRPSEMKNFDFCPADTSFIKQLQLRKRK